MSKIDPPAGWPDIDGIDTFERLLGGPVPSSPINRSIGNLTSRTKYLLENSLSASTLADPAGASLVGFQQAGVGAIARTAQAKMREVVSAEDFGAVADYNATTNAGTNNTAAFTRALTYLAARGGGVLKLAAGAYMGHITVTTSNIYVEGQGPWVTQLFNAGNSAVFQVDCSGGSVNYVGLSGVLIQNRDKAVYTAADGILIQGGGGSIGADFMMFRNLYIYKMRHNIHMRGRSIWNTWQDVRVAEAIQNGLTIDATDNFAQNVWINCRFAVSGQHGVFLNHTFSAFPTVGWTFIGCTFERNLFNGIRLTGSTAGVQAWKFIGCYWEENTQNITPGGSGGLVKAHVFCDTPSVFGLSFDSGSMFGESPGDPAMDYHIYVNTGTGGTYFGDVRGMRFGISTLFDVFWPAGVTLGKNLYTSGYNAAPASNSFVQDAFTNPSIAATPTLTLGGASAGMTYSNRKCQYVRHGNTIHFSLYISLTAKGTSTGAAVISGLPAAAVNVTGLQQAVTVYASDFVSTVAHVQARIMPGATSIELSKFASGAATTVMDTDIGNFTAMTISGSYLAQ